MALSDRTGWYTRVLAIWTAALGLAVGLSYLMAMLPVATLVRHFLDFLIWALTGGALFGRWSYASYVEEQERADKHLKLGGNSV